MPNFIPYTRENLNVALEIIGKAIYAVVGELQITAWRTSEPVPFTQRTSGERLELKMGDPWGQLFDCAWFNFTGQIPDDVAGMPVVALLDINGEMLVVDDKGIPVRGLTNRASEYDYSLGRPGKRILPITAAARGGEVINIWADAGANDLFGNLRENGVIKEAFLAIYQPDVRALYYDFEVLLDLFKSIPADSVRAHQVLTALNEAAWVAASGMSLESMRAARQILQRVLAKHAGDPLLNITAIGHAHMDLGWLWPVRETHRKGARTFATALANMELYPDYIFGASQPQLFQWMKEDYPELYTQIKKRVKEGRIEAQGAMWVESDTNLPGGESLVRQLLLGKRFFKQEFGVDVRYLWLPDVFGYSAALPQILKKAGVDYFMTQKLSWNLVNHFPHQSFKWQGIDGSYVLAHMLPEETYNSPALPRSVVRIEQNYHEKGVSDQCLMLFGIGDGGGGPGEEHLERIGRIRNLAGLSPVKQGPAAAFFETWKKDSARFPTWVGELYLERHAGTLTTEAKNKWFNRRIEQTLRQMEWMAVYAGKEYPSARLDAIWREVLLYQFHDILPGSSIKRVYDESLARYAVLLAEVQVLMNQYESDLTQTVDTRGMLSPVVVFNALSWERQAWIEAQGSWKRVTIPPMGYRAVDMALGDGNPPLIATTGWLENDILRVEFSADGSIHSVWDKEQARQVLPAGQHANRLLVYRDYGDAWDFPLDYANQVPEAMRLISSEPRMDGPRAIMKQVYQFGNSEMVQEIALTSGSRLLEFSSHLHWRETASMLRTHFPVDVHAEEASYEIQFGHVRRPTHRNTTWDLAKDEVTAHKWADLSEGNYGAALLNDSKYAYKIKGNVIELNLLRSMPYPGQNDSLNALVAPGEAHPGYTDQADHEFRYGLYPHAGTALSGGVVKAGYEFNYPLRQVGSQPHPGYRAAAGSFVELDVPNVVVETVKKAEDDGGIIVRMYESAHASTQVMIHFGFTVRRVEEVNLMEESISSALPVKDNRVELSFKPFEIKTLKVIKS